MQIGEYKMLDSDHLNLLKTIKNFLSKYIFYWKIEKIAFKIGKL